MTNKHSRLKALEKLATIAKSKAKAQSLKIESDRLSKEVSALSTEELNDRYQAVQAELANLPIDPAIANLSTQNLINLYIQKLKDS